MRLLAVVFACLIAFVLCSEVFSEELLLKPLKHGDVMAHFQFTVQWSPQDKADTLFKHYTLFPKAAGTILNEFGLQELHLTMTQGRWMYDRWGNPPFPAPAGAELAAWFTNDNTKTLDDKWATLTQSLGGLFCTSLSALQNTTIAVPYTAYSHTGRSNMYQGMTHAQFKHGLLPGEAVCIENISPWLKLLPCRSQGGLAALMSPPKKLYNAKYHSMGLHFRPTCSDEDCKKVSLELVQTLTLILATPKTKKNSISLKDLLNAKSVKPCPLATNSMIYIAHPSDKLEISATANPEQRGDLVAFDLTKREKPLSLSFKVKDRVDTAKPLFTVRRHLTGHGQQSGGFAIDFLNRGNNAVDVDFFNYVPWFVKFYFHTMKTFVNGTHVPEMKSILSSVRLEPSEDRKKPTIFEFSFTLPAHSTLSIRISFDRAFMHWTEFPPDSHRGFDLPPAMIVVTQKASSHQEAFLDDEWSPLLYKRTTQHTISRRMYTDGLTVSLPNPDFSMPYNVITMSCTAFALFFGTIYSAATRHFKNIYTGGKSFKSNRLVTRLVEKLVSFIDK